MRDHYPRSLVIGGAVGVVVVVVAAFLLIRASLSNTSRSVSASQSTSAAGDGAGLENRQVVSSLAPTTKAPSQSLMDSEAMAALRQDVLTLSSAPDIARRIGERVRFLAASSGLTCGASPGSSCCNCTKLLGEFTCYYDGEDPLCLTAGG